jgi:hypothetical protein
VILHERVGQPPGRIAELQVANVVGVSLNEAWDGLGTLDAQGCGEGFAGETMSVDDRSGSIGGG